MITKFQKERLQEYLKKDWVPEVLHELELSNITSSRGRAYGESMIRMVFTGKVDHRDIENAILVVYMKRKQAFEAFERDKKTMLSCWEEESDAESLT